MKFTKMQGAGNDFVLVEADGKQPDWSRIAVAMCDRHYGIGADGMLVMLPSRVADIRMRIFNADGSESEICGNGLRCMSKHFIDINSADVVADGISVETMAGIRKVRLSERKGKVTGIQTNMGEPKFGEREIPVKEGRCVLDIKSMYVCTVVVDGRELKLNLVNMGNPHAVYFTREPVKDYPLSQIGSKVEVNEIFPGGVNFEVVRVIDSGHIEARVWERGVGETLACGSGACAVTVAARLQGYVDETVDIKLPGGTLKVEWDGKGDVYLSGPAETVFTGEWSELGAEK